MPALCFTVPIVNPPAAAYSLQVAIEYDCQSAKVLPRDGLTFNHATFHAASEDLYVNPGIGPEESDHSVEVFNSLLQ